MSNSLSKVLITGELSKVPPEYQALFDAQKPIPDTIRFFEAQTTLADVTWRVTLGIGLIVVGLLLIVFGLVLIIVPLIGVVMVFGGVLLLRSVRTQQQNMSAQQAGQHTRYRIYLTLTDLIVRSELDYTFIPRSEYAAITDGKLYYTLNDATKFLMLPQYVVGSDQATRIGAIQQWAGK